VTHTEGLGLDGEKRLGVDGEAGEEGLVFWDVELGAGGTERRASGG